MSTGPADPRDIQWNDQWQAAERETRRTSMRAARVGIDHRPVLRADLDFPETIADQIRALFEQWANGKAATCIHGPDVQRPEPVFAAVWRPGLVVCGDCVPAHLALKGDANFTCDGCGQLDRLRTMYSAQVMVGPMAVMFGLCEDCYVTNGGKVHRR